jgi:hypothetical protein
VLVDVVGDEQRVGCRRPGPFEMFVYPGSAGALRARPVPSDDGKHQVHLHSRWHIYITLHYAEQCLLCFHNRARRFLRRGAASHAARGLIRLGEAARQHVSTWLQGSAATA